MEGGPNHGEDFLTEGEEMQAIMFGIEVDDEDDARLLGVSRLADEGSRDFHKRILALKESGGLEMARELGLAQEGMADWEIEEALYEFAAEMGAKEHGVSLEEFENNDDIEPDFEPWRYLRRKQIEGEL